MADGIRLDRQRALAEGPGAIPNLEPLFAPGAIPPVFPEGPEEGFTAGAPQVDEGLGFVPEAGSIDSPGASIGQPVPAVKESRGDRLRALLGNFLQNFGTGLQAASRAPSGAEFAAGFGGAIGAGEERRQQKTREDLLRANQASREETARENIRLRQENLDAIEREREAARVERETERVVAGRTAFQERLTAGRQRTADIVAGRRGRAGQREFLRGQQERTIEARADENKKGRQLRRELAELQREATASRGTADAKPLTEAQALRQALQEIDKIVRQDDLKLTKDKLFVGEEGIIRLRELVDERVEDLLGRKPTQEEFEEVFNQTKVDSVLRDIEAARETNVSDDELAAFVTRLTISGEINSTEEQRILEQAGLLVETPSQQESFRNRIQRRKQKQESPRRFLGFKAGIPTPGR